MVHVYSMCSTGAFHDTGIFHSCVHTQYSYRHILITLGQSTCTYTCCKHKALCSCGKQTKLVGTYGHAYVSEFEKRGNFAQNAIFCHFSAYHHFKPVRALGFRLGLQAVWTFYFTDPTLEARASLLSRAVSRQRGP